MVLLFQSVFDMRSVHSTFKGCLRIVASALSSLGAVPFIGLLLLMAGIEPNPGPTSPIDGRPYKNSSPSKIPRLSQKVYSPPENVMNQSQAESTLNKHLNDDSQNPAVVMTTQTFPSDSAATVIVLHADG